jgi:long-chain fatty acid transport protein
MRLSVLRERMGRRIEPRVSRRIRSIVPVLLAAAVCWIATGVAHADGFRLLDQGAAATGQGAAFAGQADDPSAIHYNPAGMTQLPRFQIYTGVNLVSGITDFTNTLGQRASGGTEGAVSNPPPSQFYATWSLKGLGLGVLDDLTLGVGLASPFGLQVSYSETGALANVTTHAALPLLDFKPTVAYRVAPWLSLGAGLDIYTFSDLIGDTHAEQKRIAGPEFAFVGIPPGSKLEVNGKDTAVGFNLSVLVTPWRNSDADNKPRLNLGLVYRSAVTLGMNGQFLVNGTPVTKARFDVELPWTLTTALAWWPVRDRAHEWKVEVDVDYVDWSRFKNLDVRLANGGTLPSPQNWSSTYVIMFGTEFKWLTPAGLPGWEFAGRGGYIHSETPVPSNTFGPNVPDADYNLFSVGLGLHCRPPARFLGFIPCGGGGWAPKSFGLDLAYQAVLYDSRTITNNIDPRLNGRWDTTVHVGAIAFRLSF